jgi:hypothetical protein
MSGVIHDVVPEATPEPDGAVHVTSTIATLSRDVPEIRMLAARVV